MTMAEQFDHYLVEIKRDDVGPIFVDRLNAKPNMMSGIQAAVADYQPNAVPLSEDAKKLIEDATFAEAARTIAHPQIMIRYRVGGGTVNLEESVLNARYDSDVVILSTPNVRGAFYLQIFENMDRFTTWWVDSFAGNIEETTANYIPPKSELGELIYIFAAIDHYRRVTYQNLLAHQTPAHVKVNMDAFKENLRRELQQKDIRWLLPAFFATTPGIGKYTPDIAPKHAEKLLTLQFFRYVTDKKTDETFMTFGEAGSMMGVEFLRTWLLCAGFEVNVITGQGPKDVLRFFIAPTGLTNHFISFEGDDPRSCTANHQAMTSEQLKYRMKTLFASAMERKTN